MFCLLLLLMCIICANILCDLHRPKQGLDVYDLANGELNFLKVDGCPKSPCIVEAGKDYRFTAEFRANQYTECVTIIPQYLIGDQLMPIADVAVDGCAGMSPSCPLKTGCVYQSSGSIRLRCFPPEKYLSNAIHNNMQNVTVIGLYNGTQGLLLHAVNKYTVICCNK